MPTGSKTAKKAAGKADDDNKGKKRNADGDPDKGPKAKKKDEPKAKVPKSKGKTFTGHILHDRLLTMRPQGLWMSSANASHPIGAKRAMAGRSQPYDMLLAAYQKKNQAKQQKAALDANALIEDEDDANNGPVDSDEETAAVMVALAQWNPQPLIPQPLFTPIKRQYQRDSTSSYKWQPTADGQTSSESPVTGHRNSQRAIPDCWTAKVRPGSETWESWVRGPRAVVEFWIAGTFTKTAVGDEPGIEA
ncbi:hypothetical protein ACJZ2D_016922 [Fusarium nematophilum]